MPASPLRSSAGRYNVHLAAQLVRHDVASVVLPTPAARQQHVVQGLIALQRRLHDTR